MAIKAPNQYGPQRLVKPVVGDPALDQALRTTWRAIEQLQAAGGLIHQNVTLTNNAVTTIAHGLGKAPAFVFVSPPRNAVTSGRITEVRSTSFDPTKFTQIGAYGWGADVVVDIWFVTA